MNYFRDIIITIKDGGKIYLGRCLLKTMIPVIALFIGFY